MRDQKNHPIAKSVFACSMSLALTTSLLGVDASLALADELGDAIEVVADVAPAAPEAEVVETETQPEAELASKDQIEVRVEGDTINGATYVDENGEVKEAPACANMTNKGHKVTCTYCGYTDSEQSHDFGQRGCCACGAEEHVLFYGRELSVNLVGDAKLTVIYHKDRDDAEAERVPAIFISEQFLMDEGDNHMVCAQATRCVPEGYELVEQGMLYAIDFAKPTEENFTLGAEGVAKYQSGDTASSGSFRLRKLVTDGAQKVTERGYMVVKNTATGEEKTYYSELRTAKYGELAAPKSDN